MRPILLSRSNLKIARMTFTEHKLRANALDRQNIAADSSLQAGRRTTIGFLGAAAALSGVVLRPSPAGARIATEELLRQSQPTSSGGFDPSQTPAGESLSMHPTFRQLPRDAAAAASLLKTVKTAQQCCGQHPSISSMNAPHMGMQSRSWQQWEPCLLPTVPKKLLRGRSSASNTYTQAHTNAHTHKHNHTRNRHTHTRGRCTHKNTTHTARSRHTHTEHRACSTQHAPLKRAFSLARSALSSTPRHPRRTLRQGRCQQHCDTHSSTGCAGAPGSSARRGG